jgi:hypothetical protein
LTYIEESDDEQSSIHCECSITRSLNFVAETVNCRSLISHVLVSELISHKTTYNDTNEFFLLLICFIQETDALVQEWKARTVKIKCSCWVEDLRWTFNLTELLHYEKQLYISSETSVKAELLKCYYDDELMRHFSIEWTLKLMSHKYYWSELTEDVKKYVFHVMCVNEWRCQHHLYNELQSLLCSSDS